MQSYIDLGNPVSDHPLNRGLAGWWLPLPNNQGGSKLFDLTGHGNHGTLTISPTWAGVLNGFGALQFSGANYVNVPYAANLKAAGQTYSGMVRPETTDQYQFPIATYTSNADGLEVFFENGTGVRWGSFDVKTAAYTVSLGAWAHVVGTITAAGGLELYVNGVSRATAAGCGYTGASNTAPLTIGARNGGGVYGLRGRVQSMAVHNRVVSASEAAALYHQAQRDYPDLLRRWSRRIYSFAAVAAAGGLTRGKLLLMGCGG